MKIIKIVKLKNGLYNLVLNKLTVKTFDEIIIKYNLLYKKEIDDDLLLKIMNDSKYYDIYNKALNYAVKRVRCENDIYYYLSNLEVKNSDIKSIIDKLKKINIINDKLYVRCYINDKLKLSKDGINKIKIDLLNKNINIDIINKEIENIDIDINEKLKKLIIKKINSNHKYSNYFLKNKIIRDMINLGYEQSVIDEIFEQNKKDDYNILIYNYRILLNKYKNKYKDKILESKIKSKLYMYGFLYENIKKEDL